MKFKLIKSPNLTCESVDYNYSKRKLNYHHKKHSNWYERQKKKKEKRNLKWGVGLTLGGFLILYLLINFTEYGILIKEISNIGPMVIFMIWPLIFGNVFGLISFFMIIFGLGLLIKLAIKRLKRYFNL